MKNQIWEKLYHESSSLTRPVMAEGLIPENQIEEFKSLLLSIIREFLRKGDLHLGLKTYIDNIQRQEIPEIMASKLPQQDETLENWAYSIFGDQKFGVILNYLEDYSNEFSEKVAILIKPLLEKAGLPLEGISFLFFMGNYGFTPFGIHKENVGEEGVLFHLGPGEKQFYTWDKPEYNVIEHNSQIFRNIDEMLPESVSHNLKPGNAMFIPHQVFHVADTPEFSISFVMDYINPPMDRFENELLKAANEENIILQNNYQSPLKSSSKPTEWSQNLNQDSLQKKLEIALRRHILSLKSNGGIKRKSKINNSAHLPNGNFLIIGKSIFPIQYDKQLDGGFLLFARGHRIKSKDHPKLSLIIHRLNNGESFDLNAIQNLLLPDWDMVDIFSLIAELHKTETIEIQPKK